MQQDRKPLNEKPLNEKGERHGFWRWHAANTGDIFLQTHFINDEPYGYLYYRPLLRYNREIREQHEYHAR